MRINIYASRNWACHREPSPYAASELICTCKPCRKRRICALRFGDRLFRVSLELMQLGRSDRDDCAPSDCVNLRHSSIIFLSFFFSLCCCWMEILEALVFFFVEENNFDLSILEIFIIEYAMKQVIKFIRILGKIIFKNFYLINNVLYKI